MEVQFNHKRRRIYEPRTLLLHSSLNKCLAEHVIKKNDIFKCAPERSKLCVVQMKCYTYTYVPTYVHVT